jgi:hypothetical protein
MIITYHRLESIKIQFGDTVLAFNPLSKKSVVKRSRFGADIALVSINDPNMNGVDTVTYGDKEPFAIYGPGEYEVKDIFIRGFASVSHHDSTSEGPGAGGEMINTIYSVNVEGMSVVYLGALGEEMPSETIEKMDSVDILFVPIGGQDNGVLSPDKAHKLAVMIQPKLIIPIHFGEGVVGDKAGKSEHLKKFLKEAGEENVKSVDKLTIKQKDLSDKEGDIAVLSAT